jgi:hypothetical protein
MSGGGVSINGVCLLLLMWKTWQCGNGERGLWERCGTVPEEGLLQVEAVGLPYTSYNRAGNIRT